LAAKNSIIFFIFQFKLPDLKKTYLFIKTKLQFQFNNFVSHQIK